jgi:hypothetical protein
MIKKLIDEPVLRVLIHTTQGIIGRREPITPTLQKVALGIAEHVILVLSLHKVNLILRVSSPHEEILNHVLMIFVNPLYT